MCVWEKYVHYNAQSFERSLSVSISFRVHDAFVRIYCTRGDPVKKRFLSMFTEPAGVRPSVHFVYSKRDVVIMRVV